MSKLKNSFLTWFSYNVKANRQFIEIFQRKNSLPNEAANIFSHILNSHIIWLNRIHTLDDVTIPSPWDKQSIADFTSINEKNYELTEWFLQAERYGMSLSSTITYQNTKGKEYENTICEIYFHILAHSTYHRGQVAKQFRSVNIDPPVTDFIFHMRHLRMEGEIA